MAEARYVHGHAEPVLRSHRWRTAENSAAYLLPHLRDGDAVLDVGCGPATITADLARRLPASTVLGVDLAAEVLAGALAELDDVPPNLELRTADLLAGDLPAGAFDVVHAHQVLQHLGDPVAALAEMRRLCRPGGIVAVRDADYGAMTWAPQVGGMDRWLDAYRRAHRAAGAEPDAGRHLLGWANAAGFTAVAPSASTWCFATPEDRDWWGGLWADRITAPASRLHQQLRADGLDDDDLGEMAAAWRTWAAHPDGWFAVLHGEVLARA